MRPSRRWASARSSVDAARPAARRRSAPRRRRCGTAAWTCGPAARGAARPAPCAAGSAAAPRPRRACRSRSARARTYAAYPPSYWRTAPSATSQVRSHTASRNHRSWVTTSSAPRQRAQVVGQPVDALDVEVVGRLVEHEQVGLLRPARRPATTRRRSPPDSRATSASSPTAGRPEPGQHRAHRRVAGPLVLGGEPVGAQDDVPHARAGGQLAALVDGGDPQPAGAGDPAGVGLLGAGHQPQQRRLAAAVAADDADPLAGGDAERDVVEHGRRAVGLADPSRG